MSRPAPADEKGGLFIDFLCSLHTLPRVLSVNYFHTGGPWSHFRRRSDETVLYYLLEGEMHLREGERDYTLESGDVFLLQPGLVHEGTRKASCAYYFVHFKNVNLLPLPEHEAGPARLSSLGSLSAPFDDPRADAQYDASFCLLPKRFRVSDPDTARRLTGFFDEMIDKTARRAENYKIHCSCRLLELLMTLSERRPETLRPAGPDGASPRVMTKVRRLAEFLNGNYREKLTGARIEEEFGANFDYLNRVFRKETGQTVFQYLAGVRINRAKELLAATDMKLARVAAECGFSDEFYFSRQFKKHTGISPKLFAGSRSLY